ncbi:MULTISPECIES: restriction endonuclease subunit S [Bifidobacterium]|uniref:restriction endonuclease subunit S n=1 Tax=Bifidobacterium TaxID=1678 RepID=UPI0013D14EB0|nr:restriction endonuclease subunit S [Bifidobacterium saimiriisciurei]
MPQDPAEGTGSELVEHIHEERRQLVAEKKIKPIKGGESTIHRDSAGHWFETHGKNAAVCIDDEIPFDIPDSWTWARFNNVLFNRDSERIPLSSNIRKKLTKKYDYYGASGIIDQVDKYLFAKPLLLIGEDGANLINRSSPIAFIARGKYWVNNHAHVLDAVSETLLEYCSIYVNSISLYPYVTGTAQPKLSQERMGVIVVPVPPLAEQQRIVEKVAEFRSLIGERFAAAS